MKLLKRLSGLQNSGNNKFPLFYFNFKQKTLTNAKQQSNNYEIIIDIKVILYYNIFKKKQKYNKGAKMSMETAEKEFFRTKFKKQNAELLTPSP